MDELLGTEVGNYRLIRVLGEGGMGRVYVGEQAAIASRVAIKVLTTKDPDLVARFFAEAKAVNVIKHPGLVKVLALANLPDGRPYIIMELVEGETLRTLVVRDSPLPIGGVLDMMKQLLAALGAAHARSVVHRDLKPDNVMITPDGNVKILDFGIAKLSSTLGGGNLTQIGAQIGTPAYMAPEQIRGEEVDGRTDVYAAGVVLYEALTGRHPFEAESEYKLLEGHLQAPPPRLFARRRDVPAELEPIVEKALAKKPGDRYASAAELSAAIDAAIDKAGLPRQKLIARLPVTGPRAFDAFRATLDEYPHVKGGAASGRPTVDGKRRTDDRATSDELATTDRAKRDDKRRTDDRATRDDKRRTDDRATRDDKRRIDDRATRDEVATPDRLTRDDKRRTDDRATRDALATTDRPMRDDNRRTDDRATRDALATNDDLTRDDRPSNEHSQRETVDHKRSPDRPVGARRPSDPTVGARRPSDPTAGARRPSNPTAGARRPSDPAAGARLRSEPPAGARRWWLAIPAIVLLAGVVVFITWPRGRTTPSRPPVARAPIDAALSPPIDAPTAELVVGTQHVGGHAERVARIDAVVDPARFDVLANVSKAQLLARQLVPDVVLTGFRIDHANARGGVGFDGTSVVAYYFHLPGAVPAEPDDVRECNVGVTVSATGWEARSMIAACPEQVERRPRCKLADVWTRAAAQGQKRTTARIEWLDGRWLFNGEGTQLEIEDDCTAATTPAPVVDKGASHAYFESDYDMNKFDAIAYIATARKHARKLQPDVELSSMTVGRQLSGNVDLTTTEYVFVTAGPKRASTCTAVTVTFTGSVEVSRAENQPCAPKVSAPHCSVAQIWTRARVTHGVITFSALGWLVGTDIYADDCSTTGQATPAPAPTPTTGSSETTIPYDFDPKHFDPIAYIPTAKKHARDREATVELNGFYFSNVSRDGFVDLGGSPQNGYQFSTKGTWGTATCTWVSVSFFGGNISISRREDLSCNMPAMRAPRCTVAQIAEKAHITTPKLDIMVAASGWQFGKDTYEDDCK